ncbi:hypothetical protein NE237_025194 [Protea cynaroides]|uniref:Selenoprotein H n=1 Tax=Protea cynaroides TaxID=273540 RepID=A0A9Q0K1I5_9MAGN|nr:hypothetical protein NE237_025194 [Protea cynaroides]
MARKRKSVDGVQSKVAAETAAAAPPMAENRRVTRSSAKAAATGVDASGPVVLPAAGPKKREKKSNKEPVKQKEEETEDTKGSKIADAPEEKLVISKTIIIEHCKQCQSFKKRAELVKDGLEKVVPGIIVKVNPEKPRRGCFEIREEGGEKFVSLLDMPRPFGKMKALDMDKVISDIIVKIE